MSEYELLQQLEEEGLYLVPQEEEKSDLLLFRKHFLLFHLLYKLRRDLRESGQGDLSIHCLGIKRLAYITTGKNAIADNYDPLADYYLDIKQLENTGSEEVAALLDNFWKHYLAFTEDALGSLGLKQGASYEEVKLRYRELVKEHHPDQGGDPAAFRKIQNAMELLEEQYKNPNTRVESVKSS